MSAALIPLAIKTMAAAGGTLMVASAIWWAWWKSLSPREQNRAEFIAEQRAAERGVNSVLDLEPSEIDRVLKQTKSEIT